MIRVIEAFRKLSIFMNVFEVFLTADCKTSAKQQFVKNSSLKFKAGKLKFSNFNFPPIKEE